MEHRLVGGGAGSSDAEVVAVLLILENITARGVTPGTNFDHGVMRAPVPANALTY
ncbi:hypothetical protein HY480_00080 [Candidatus Uhrbacteria bacterium]|nr:hypothetical protein [Candidatus Uhrbacteria bacterium]